MEVTKRKKPYMRSFWTPALANILFWFCALIFSVSAAFAFVAGQMVTALMFVGAILLQRVLVECAVILFQIHDVLVDIRSQGDIAVQKDQEEKSARLLAARIAAVRKETVPGEHRLG